MKHLAIRITDMKCAGCESTIRKALLKLDGVYDARGDHKSGLVWIEASDGFSLLRADQAIRELGYTPEERGDE